MDAFADATTTTTAPPAASVAAAQQPPVSQAPPRTRPTGNQTSRSQTTPRPTVVSGQEATLSIPSIGLTLPIFVGGQSTIDRGVVTHYVSPEERPPVPPGSPGTYWLAAHHSTHGAPFGRLPALQNGAKVDVIVGNTTYIYTVTSREVTGAQVSKSTVYGPDRTTPRILLQTCEGSADRLLIHGVLTGTS
jgi:sortase (surface protein transpeptidase)